MARPMLSRITMQMRTVLGTWSNGERLLSTQGLVDTPTQVAKLGRVGTSERIILRAPCFLHCRIRTLVGNPGEPVGFFGIINPRPQGSERHLNMSQTTQWAEWRLPACPLDRDPWCLRTSFTQLLKFLAPNPKDGDIQNPRPVGPALQPQEALPATTIADAAAAQAK
jgi:hypothetical protein